MRRGGLPHALVGLEGNTPALVRSRTYGPAILVERQDVPAPRPLPRCTAVTFGPRTGTWLQLRRGCQDLLGLTAHYSTPKVAANSRAFTRLASKASSKGYQELLDWLDKKYLINASDAYATYAGLQLPAAQGGDAEPSTSHMPPRSGVAIDSARTP
jgi:hypothetical protein